MTSASLFGDLDTMFAPIWLIGLTTTTWLSVGTASFGVHPQQQQRRSSAFSKQIVYPSHGNVVGSSIQSSAAALLLPSIPIRLGHAELTTQDEFDDDDSIQKYSQDVSKVLNELRPAPLDETIPAIFRSKPLSFTRLWNLEDWSTHTSRWRYVRYLTGLSKSNLLRRTWPQLMALTAWSIVAVVLRAKNMVVDIPLTSISLVSSFVAALLTLRSNQSLARLSDCLVSFGKAVLYTRDAAQMIVATVYPKDRATAMIMIRHLTVFVWLLKSHLRDSSEEDIVRAMIPDPQDVNYILGHRKTPVAVLSKLRQCIAHLVDEGILHTADQLELEHHVVELNHVIMTTERIRATPIPPLYTSHTGRLLLVNLCLLPLALTTPNPVIQTGKLASVVVTTVLVGFAMFGLDEISHTLEQPLRLMPLYQISKEATMDVSDTVTSQPPPLVLAPPPPPPLLNGDDKTNGNINEVIMASPTEMPLMISSDAVISTPNPPAYW